MASRTTYSEMSAPPVSGEDLLEEYADRIKTLFDASSLPLTAVGGTGNAVTATLDPPLDGGGLVDGMKFEITWGAANTAGVTLALNGGSAIAVLDASGTALTAGAVGSGLRSLLEYIAGAFRILSPLLTTLTGGATRYYWQFTASGTWNKPAGVDDDAMVNVEAWAGGGGGSSATNGGGGGGGGWTEGWFRAGDLPSSVSVTIGAGGAVGSNGGSTTFGAILTAFPGLAGANPGGGRGGSAAANGLFGAGNGASAPGANGANASSENGGGGGGAGDTVSASAGNGGQALRGGGGGAGRSSGNGFVGTGGASVFGGNGGDGNVAGVAPGGGGGRNAAGARGELRVWI